MQGTLQEQLFWEVKNVWHAMAGLLLEDLLTWLSLIY